MRQTGHFQDAFQYYQKALESTAGSDAITPARASGKMAELRWPLDDIGGALTYDQRALAELSPRI